MTVLNGDGLVGRLKIVGATTSTVLLAIDPEFNVGVRLPNNAMGIVSGHGRSAMSLEMLDPTARVKVGDGLVTQGSLDQTPFVWGVPVGSVISATNPLAGDVQTGEVKPYVDFSTLDLVGIVVQPPRVDPRDALLAPPLPTVTVTTTATATATATVTAESAGVVHADVQLQRDTDEQVKSITEPNVDAQGEPQAVGDAQPHADTDRETVGDADRYAGVTHHRDPHCDRRPMAEIPRAALIVVLRSAGLPH